MDCCDENPFVTMEPHRHCCHCDAYVKCEQAGPSHNDIDIIDGDICACGDVACKSCVQKCAA